ncbi:MAG: hypothetical protein KA313_07565 [Pseudarcicella sp.]|nr:hypothetical protein [Pseudarcicella sp.]MBP6410937.1 hypothetical protein [Pseudarcicella sp.]
MTKKHSIAFAIILLVKSTISFSQNSASDLLDILKDDSLDTTPIYTTSTFKTTRVINGQSVESVAPRHLDFRISHRFGKLSDGYAELWGLDQARIRMGLEYGINDRLMVGIGRSSHQKTWDYFAKYKLLKQSNQKHHFASISAYLAAFTNTMATSPARKFYNNTERQSYCGQIIIAKKINDKLSLQLSPTFLHNNKTETLFDENDIFSIGWGGRYKISKRTSFNLEYYYTPQKIGENYQRDPLFKNNLSLGFDIETGGHVFQLHLSNSRGVIESQYIGSTDGSWSNGDIFYGFNISRVFSFDKKQSKK